MTTLERHSKETSSSIHEPSLRMAADGEQGKRQHLTDNDKHGTVVRTSILDEFI